MKKYLVLLSLILLVSMVSAVTWTLTLMDSYGDGWNGGLLTLNVNGNPVLSGCTVSNGYGPVNYTFDVNNGDQITTLYTPGSWAYENEYYIYDHNSTLIASEGVGGVQPNSITVPIVVVAPVGMPGSPTNPSPANNAIDQAVSGTITWTFGADTTTYDLWFGPSGNMQQVVTGAAAGASGSYNYSGLDYLTQYTWRVVAHNTNRFTTNGPIWQFSTVIGPDFVQIGTDVVTAHLPINAYYGYSYSQTYYLASEIGSPGNVNAIYYYWNGTAANPASNSWTVYMKNSPNTVFSSNTAWETGLTQVFTGTVNCPASPGWVSIPLDTPFLYDGISSLVIGVYENAPGWDNPYGYFFNTPVTGTRAMIYYNDSTNPDPLAPPQANMTGTTIPNLMMDFTPSAAGQPAAPILVAPGEHISGVSPSEVQFVWTPDLVNGQLPETYNLHIAETSQLPDPFNSDDFFAVATSFEGVISGVHPAYAFDFSTNYTWTVEALTTGYDSEFAWPPWDFTTAADPTITTFPYNQDFETWPPLDWDIDNGTFQWTQYVDGNANHWALANYWGQTEGNTDIMITPPFSSPDPLQLGFVWSHQFNATYPNDALTVQISDDMSTWVDLWNKAGADFESGDGATSIAPGTGVLQRIFVPAQYLGNPFWIRFYGYSGYGPDLFVDNFTMGPPIEHDVAVTSIDIPGVVGVDPIAPQVTVANQGASSESFTVQLTIGTGYNQTAPVVALAPGASTQLTYPLFTPTSGSVYAVDCVAILPTDQNLSNNSMYKTIASLNTNYQAYADVAYSGGGTTGPATFMLNNPGLITDLPAVNPWEGNFLAGADWIDGEWFGYEYAAFRWWQVDTTTGAGTHIGTGSVDITGIAYNPTTGTIYAAGATDLYTLDPLTGALSYVGNYGIAGSVVITAAYSNLTNTLYAVDLVSDGLYTINTATGAATLVGTLGLGLNYAQDMSFNQNDGLLYLAGYTTTGSLYWVDTNTGAASLIGPFQGGWEIDGFVIPYGLATPEVSIAPDGTLSWNAVSGATMYNIYASQDPMSGFEYQGSTSNTSWQDPSFPQAKKFYQVKATDTVVRTAPTQIRYEGDVYRDIRNIPSNEIQTHRRYTPPVK